MITLFWIFVGMMIGWNLLPQPAWAANLWSKIMATVFGKNSEE